MASSSRREPLAAPPIPPSSRTAAVIYNPIKVEVGDLEAAVEAEQAAAGWSVLWFETTEEDPGGGRARAALDAGAAVVIVAGGDGTVREVAQVLRGTQVELALLPSGTGNLLARNLDFTLNDVEQSIRTAFTGTERRIDVAVMSIRRADGEVEERAFLVMGGVGLDAKIMANTDDDLKAKLGWLAYGQALFATLRSGRPLRLRYRTDGGRVHTTKAEAIIVGNCGSLPANILLLPDAEVDDGLLDVVVLTPESLRGWIGVIVTVFLDNGIVRRLRPGRKTRGLQVDAVDFHQVTTLEVKLGRPEELELDGDSLGRAVGFDCRIEPLALRLRVPDEKEE